MMIDPHTRAIGEEGCPESALNQYQLGLVNKTVLAEDDKISSGLVPEFRKVTARIRAIIVAAESAFSRA